MFIKKLTASAIVLFALATGMASIGGVKSTTPVKADQFTPYTQTALLVNHIATQHTVHQTAAAK